MIVIGAGMAGLLAAGMLRNECTHIMESSSELPNNHSAVLRFRSKVVSDVLNIPFKEVGVLKAVHPWRNPVADVMAYSRKTNGTSTLRSITSANGEINKRYIAPPDFIQRMADCVSAEFHFSEKFSLEDACRLADTPMISTMPMPVLMDIFGWENKPEFKYVDGVNIIADIDGADAYCSLYVPDPNFLGARISLTGNQMIIECPNTDASKILPPTAELLILKAADYMGIHEDDLGRAEIKEQKYAKILPIDEAERKRFILWASEKFNVYSLGRFATWRPGLLLDDVVNDVRVIHKLINGGSSYDHRKS